MCASQKKIKIVFFHNLIVYLKKNNEPFLSSIEPSFAIFIFYAYRLS